jgi:hypothetical protein
MLVHPQKIESEKILILREKFLQLLETPSATGRKSGEDPHTGLRKIPLHNWRDFQTTTIKSESLYNSPRTFSTLARPPAA